MWQLSGSNLSNEEKSCSTVEVKKKIDGSITLVVIMYEKGLLHYGGGQADHQAQFMIFTEAKQVTASHSKREDQVVKLFRSSSDFEQLKTILENNTVLLLNDV